MATLTPASRAKLIGKFFEEHPSEWFTSKELTSKLGIPRTSVKNDISKIRSTVATNGEVLSQRGFGYMFVPYASGSKKTETVEKPNKNSEGYPDPTASKAIRNAEKDAKSNELYPMDVWEFEESNGFTSPFLIVKAFDRFAMGYRINECSAEYKIENEYFVSITYMGSTYVFDIRRLITKPVKYAKKRLWSTEKDINDVFKMFTEAIGVEMPVIIKNVELDPNPDLEKKYHEACVTIANMETTIDDLKAHVESLTAENECLKTQTEMKLLQQKVEIYEKLLHI